jgi:hypothetical protein
MRKHDTRKPSVADKNQEHGVSEQTDSKHAPIEKTAVNELPVQAARGKKDESKKKSGREDQNPATATVTIPEKIDAPNTPVEMLQRRIPPNVDTFVDVQVSELKEGDAPVYFSVDGRKEKYGTATVNGVNSFEVTAAQSLKLALKGAIQTAAGKGGKLKLTAHQGGKEIAKSGGFSVAAIPEDWSVTLKSRIDDADRKGFAVKDNWKSDGGGDPKIELSEISISEVVRDYNAVGVYTEGGTTSGYLPAKKGFTSDYHTSPESEFAGLGSLSADQVSIFKDKRTGAENIPVKNSGFKIDRATTAALAGSGFRFNFDISKYGSNAQAGGYTSNAGNGNVSEHFNVV